MICVRRDVAARTSENVKLPKGEIYRPIFDAPREYRAAFLLADVSRIQDIGGDGGDDDDMRRHVFRLTLFPLFRFSGKESLRRHRS